MDVFKTRRGYDARVWHSRQKGLVKAKFLHGEVALPKVRGLSKTLHCDLSSKAQINYQYCDNYRTGPEGIFIRSSSSGPSIFCRIDD